MCKVSQKSIRESWRNLGISAKRVLCHACLVVQFYPWFKFISLCFKLIIIHYHTQKQTEIKFKPSIKLNHNIYKFYRNICYFLDVSCVFLLQ